MDTVDVVVIGGGIAGASAAYELAASCEVLLVEQEAQCGYHTTGRSAAVFTVAYERGVVQALAVASRPFLADPPPEVAERSVLHHQPFMMIAAESQRPKLAAALANARARAPDVVELTPGEARELCPVLRPGYVALAVLEPDAASIDVHALHDGFLRAARRRGTEVRVSCPVVAIEAGSSGWHVRTADGGRIAAGAVVNAAGAWAGHVAAMAGARPVMLQPYRRTAFTFAAPAGLDVRPLPMTVDVDERFYFEPEGDGFLGSLAEETPMEPHDVRPEEADVALAIERIQEATTLTIRHVRSAWAGLRTFAPDRYPVIGEDPERPGFYWLAGQGGFGILTSPAAARTLAGLVTSGEVPADVAAGGVSAAELSPARF